MRSPIHNPLPRSLSSFLIGLVTLTLCAVLCLSSTLPRSFCWSPFPRFRFKGTHSYCRRNTTGQGVGRGREPSETGCTEKPLFYNMGDRGCACFVLLRRLRWGSTCKTLDQVMLPDFPGHFPFCDKVSHCNEDNEDFATFVCSLLSSACSDSFLQRECIYELVY